MANSIFLPALEDTPGVFLDDRLPDAALKVIGFHHERMVLNEQGTLLGADEERLHDMRVAIRRMRVAILVFGIPYPDKKILRKTANILGEVRDLDVFMEKTRAYIESLPNPGKIRLDPLEAEWFKLREAARSQMLVFLEAEGYIKIKQDLVKFVEQWALSEHQNAVFAKDAALGLIRSCLQNVIETRNEWADPNIKQYHTLRIAFKKLRYTIEFFADVLDENGFTLCIELLKGIQDCLGDIHDSWAAITFVSGFLENFTWDLENQDQRSVTLNYLTWRQLELTELKAGYTKLWEQFMLSNFNNLLLLKTQ